MPEPEAPNWSQRRDKKRIQFLSKFIYHFREREKRTASRCREIDEQGKKR